MHLIEAARGAARGDKGERPEGGVALAERVPKTKRGKHRREARRSDDTFSTPAIQPRIDEGVEVPKCNDWQALLVRQADLLADKTLQQNKKMIKKLNTQKTKTQKIR